MMFWSGFQSHGLSSSRLPNLGKRLSETLSHGLFPYSDHRREVCIGFYRTLKCIWTRRSVLRTEPFLPCCSSWNRYAENLGLDHRVLGPQWRTFWLVPPTEDLPQRSYCLGYHLNTNKLLCNTGRSQTYLLRYTYEILGNDGLVIVGESVLCLFQSLCSGNDFWSQWWCQI